MSTIYDECSKEELLQIVSEMQTDLNNCKNDLKQTIDELRTENKFLTLKTNSQKSLIKRIDAENTALREDVTIAINDYKKCHDEKIRLVNENNELKTRLKILNNPFLNSIYGITGTIYADTDSIKETKKHDDNN